MIKDVFIASFIYLFSFVITFTIISTGSYYIEGISLSTILTYQEKIYLFIGIISGMMTILLIDLYKRKSSNPK